MTSVGDLSSQLIIIFILVYGLACSVAGNCDDNAYKKTGETVGDTQTHTFKQCSELLYYILCLYWVFIFHA